MKRLPLSLLTLLLLAAAPAPADEPKKAPQFVVYAQFIEDTKVILDDGSHWAMDKGDCFPVDMFKEHQTKVILKLGGATFMTETVHMRIMKDSEEPLALKSYRVTLENFVKSKGDRWKKEAEANAPVNPVIPPKPPAKP